ncbi:hypothetical protein TSMEX_008546 [Taenia solium]|eukprot:TsM_001147600 transcript=TsM_001147600 gene=TsM_001147600
MAFRISNTRIAPGYPQGNGLVERTDRAPIRKHNLIEIKAWDALLAYRATIHTSAGVSPFKMLTDQEMRAPSDSFPPNKEVAASPALDREAGTQLESCPRKAGQFLCRRQRPSRNPLLIRYRSTISSKAIEMSLNNQPSHTRDSGTEKN